MRKQRVKKCQFCNEVMQNLTGCMNCQEESILKEKVKKVMGEFKEGTLHSGHAGIVKNPKQAIAIALSVGRKEVAKKKK